MEEMVDRWLTANGINFRRADDMKTRLDFFLPDFNVYIEVKRFHTPRINDQLERATDIIIVQGPASMRFLESFISRGNSSAVEQAAYNRQVGGSNPSSPTTPSE